LTPPPARSRLAAAAAPAPAYIGIPRNFLHPTSDTRIMVSSESPPFKFVTKHRCRAALRSAYAPGPGALRAGAAGIPADMLSLPHEMQGPFALFRYATMVHKTSSPASWPASHAGATILHHSLCCSRALLTRQLARARLGIVLRCPHSAVQTLRVLLFARQTAV
jgi:hypothetical protein